MSLSVAIVGRPNVGKSTLFNRLAGRKLALVHDTPGVTRDRREHEVRFGDYDLTLIDTAGLEDAADGALEARMRAGTERAIGLADLTLFLVDGREGITGFDQELAAILRRGGKPVVLVVNKTEGRGLEGFYDAYGLGLGEPIPISAEHGEGIADLYQAIRPHAEGRAEAVEPEEQDWDDPLKPLRVAIVGRPNAGKSTLINQVLREDRMLVGPEAGITRDSIGVEWTYEGEERDWPVKLFDTAGLRRKAKVQDRLERMSTQDTTRAIRFAEVVVVMMDATTPYEKQDLQIADLAVREGRAVVLCANKWDLVEDRSEAGLALREAASRLLPQLPGVPIVTLSALTGQGLKKLMPAVTKVYVDWNASVKTSALNEWLAAATGAHPPPAVHGRRIKIRYVAQIKSRPPTFVAHCQRADEVPKSYERYLVNSLREAFEIAAVPIRLYLRAQENPYAEKAARRPGLRKSR